MNENANFTQNMDTLFSDLQNFVKTDSVIGSPVTVGDKTLVPVMSVALGYGSTGMAKRQQSDNTNASNGVGLGAKISTSAVVVIDKDSVSMLPVNGKNNMGQLMDKLPQALTSLGQNMMSQGANQGQQQNQMQNQQNQQPPQQGTNNNQMQNSNQQQKK